MNDTEQRYIVHTQGSCVGSYGQRNHRDNVDVKRNSFKICLWICNMSNLSWHVTRPKHMLTNLKTYFPRVHSIIYPWRKISCQEHILGSHSRWCILQICNFSDTSCWASRVVTFQLYSCVLRHRPRTLVDWSTSAMTRVAREAEALTRPGS